MQPWQVSLGLSLAIIVPLVYFLAYELNYLDGYWHLVLRHYAFHLVSVVLAVYLTIVFGLYALARTLVLGDVGQRVTIMDKTIREGRAGDPGLTRMLQQEETGEFDS